MDKTVPPGAAILLDFIRETEVGRKDRASYDVIYGHNQDKLPQPLTTMTYGEIVDAQKSWSKRFGSSAAGAYQFMKATLQDLARANLSEINGAVLFTADLQDRLAYKLLVRRGYPKFITGQISLVEFAENLAKEWASFPVLADTQGATRQIKRGQSYYVGDGVNKALVKPQKVEAVLRQVLEAARRPHEVEEEPEAAPVPLPVPKPKPKPVRKSGRFWTWLLTAGGTIITALKELNLVALDWRVQIAILVTIVGFAIYAISSMPAVRNALGLK
ncbi:membrane protein [Sinorhizobium sp. CCBAU 05631]|uniref:membrane protein n=1 Tax=Sinorhizobium sp. CCBAU 05631 TaxID=794846 RepID=UPI0004B73F5E|nr:membrane protein [Sinorhizobium sp. CCBAU 05631]ASY56502.1 Flagellar protein FlgJ [peptidoglycan hydrolase] [Sinorhizobium sp. CCBAU 05631]